MSRNQMMEAGSKAETFGEFLEICGEISCELIIGGVDGTATFEWDSADCKLLPPGKRVFKKILDAHYTILENGNIEIYCDDEELGADFLLTWAGYAPDVLWHRWFQMGDDKEAGGNEND